MPRIAGDAPSRQLDPERLGDHLDRLYRAALGLCGSAADADDLVQETFVQVLRKPRLLRSDDDLGYLMRVLRNTFHSRHRSESRRPRTTELEDELAAAGRRLGRTTCWPRARCWPRSPRCPSRSGRRSRRWTSPG